MKTISVAVSEDDYESFREVAKLEHRSVAQLIREAMALYRISRARKPRLTRVPVLIGHQPVGALPARGELYDEAFSRGPSTK